MFFHHLETDIDLIIGNGHRCSSIRLPEVGRRTEGQFERPVATIWFWRNRVAQILSGTRTDEIASLIERGAGAAISALDANTADAGAGFRPVEDGLTGLTTVANHLAPWDFTEMTFAASTHESNG